MALTRSSSARRGAASRPSSRWAITRGSIAASARPALMRQAVAQAVHHARHRTAFQKKLIDQPLMTNVLADLALEVRGGDRADNAACPRLRRER